MRSPLRPCCDKERESKGCKTAMRCSKYGVLMGFVLIAIFHAYATTVRASSDRHRREKRKVPKKSINEEIASMTLPPCGNNAIKESLYTRNLFTRTNTELASFYSDEQYFQYIYRKKEYADLDIAKYSMADIKYRTRVPRGAYSLRILDSRSDEVGRKQRNRVFVKLLYSFYLLINQSMIIENIRIESDEHELLEPTLSVWAALMTDRLVFRNVTTETIRVFFKRIGGEMHIGRLCIEECAEIRLNHAVAPSIRTYKISGLEFTDLGTLIDGCQVFLGCIEHIEYLKIHRVNFIHLQLVAYLLSIVVGTLEIDWGVYKQVPIETWANCAQGVTNLHLADIKYIELDQSPSRCASGSFDSIETLSLSVQRVQSLNASMLQDIALYVKKHYKHVKNVVVKGRIDMNDLKSAIGNRSTELSKLLLAHKTTHFTFADSTVIDTKRKHLMFIPFSIYKETTHKELKSRLGVLSEVRNWEWNNQEKYWKPCSNCKVKKDVYVTQFKNGEAYCKYKVIRSIIQQKKCNSGNRNMRIRSKHYTWYPKHAIFLQKALNDRLYLAETQNIFKMAQKSRDDAKKRKRKAQTTTIFKCVMHMHHIRRPRLLEI